MTGAYNCWCVEGYFYPVVGGLYFTGRELETFFQEGRILRPDMFRCVVCAPGCDDCVDHAPCLYQRDRGLLLVLMVLMILIILGIAVLAALTYYFRTEMVRLTVLPAKSDSDIVFCL